MEQQQQSQDILQAILSVLQSIEHKLDRYEGRLATLERSQQVGGDTPNDETAVNSATDADQEPQEQDDEDDDDDAVVLQDNPGTTAASTLPKIIYSEWYTNRLIVSMPQALYDMWDAATTPLDEFFDLQLSQNMEQRLGDCWSMPGDQRLPLKFFKDNILQTNFFYGATPGTLLKGRQTFEKELNLLCTFDQDLRSHKGNDFVVVDFDAYNNSRVYRLGESAVGPDLLVDVQEAQEAPWTRIVLYQGATTGGSISPNRKRPEQPVPYFSRHGRTGGIWDHISSHLQLKPRGIIVNPYANSIWTGFHTIFYEICETVDPIEKELWKHGPLYDHPLGWQFRKCAYTLYSPLSDKESNKESKQGHRSKFWTILILSPSGFFDERIRSFPVQEIGFGQSQALGHCFGRLSRLGAEMNLIGNGLERISERWASFQGYFDFILDSGDSLMKPSEHDNLLFDDGAFSRSRKYFWAIECLAEFDKCISDNLLQWDLYKAARVPITIDFLTRLDSVQFAFVERQYAMLQIQRDSFRQKLSAIKALRDALFNASAVIESRASTRLGENVKLLTFVSIFFLPLAFTTSLWSVNDKFSMSVLIYVIIIVAISTYLVMFNINSLAQGFSKLYDIKKRKIVSAMKTDPREVWRARGHRFEVFRPKHENPEPSEWYIPLYTILRPGVLLRLLRSPLRSDAAVHHGHAKDHSRGRTWFKRFMRNARKSPDEEIKPSDEGWVM